MPEISDADYELLQLQKKVLGDKELRASQLRLIKKADPNRAIPEIDAEDRIMSAVAPLQEENKKLREEIEQREVLNGLKAKRANAERLLKEKGLSVDVSAVEKLMVEKGLSSHDTAIEFLELNSRVSAPKSTPSWDNRVKVAASDDMKKDINGWARKMAADTIDQLQGVKR